MPSQKTLPAVVTHGADCLPSVEVDDYNVELKDDEGFVGDRASKSAFRDIISHLRGALSKAGIDPLGDADSDSLSKKNLDDLFARGDPEAAGLVQGAIIVTLHWKQFLSLTGISREPADYTLRLKDPV